MNEWITQVKNVRLRANLFAFSQMIDSVDKLVTPVDFIV